MFVEVVPPELEPLLIRTDALFRRYLEVGRRLELLRTGRAPQGYIPAQHAAWEAVLAGQTGPEVERFRDLRIQVEAEERRLWAERRRLREELVRCWRGLPVRWRQPVDLLMRAGRPLLVGLDGRACGACRTLLPLSHLREAFAGRLIRCPECGVFLGLRDRVYPSEAQEGAEARQDDG